MSRRAFETHGRLPRRARLLIPVIAVAGACSHSDGRAEASDGGPDREDERPDAGVSVDESDSGPSGALDGGDLSEDSGSGDADAFPAPIGSEADGDAALGIGTGRAMFVPLLHGDPLRWEAGVQGGHHVWVSARLEAGVAFPRENQRREVSTRFLLTRRGGSSLGDLTRFGGYRANAGGWELLGNFSVLPRGIRPGGLDDEPLLLSVEVSLSEEGSGPLLRRDVWVRSACCD